MKRILCLAALGFTLQAYAADDSIKKEAAEAIILKRKVYIALKDVEKAQRIMRRCKHSRAEFFEAEERKAEAQRVLDDYERTAGPKALADIKELRRLEAEAIQKLMWLEALHNIRSIDMGGVTAERLAEVHRECVAIRTKAKNYKQMLEL